jgi:hypothetical protein
MVWNEVSETQERVSLSFPFIIIVEYKFSYQTMYQFCSHQLEGAWTTKTGAA